MEPYQDVSYANELVRQVREAKTLALKQVALATGYSKSAINRYELGQAPVPADYFARLFVCTADLRLIQYVWPGVTLHMTRVSPPGRVPPPGDPVELIPRELEAIERTAQAARYVHRIVADGRIDESDDHALGKLQEAHNDVRQALASVDRALIAWRQANAPPPGGNRRPT